VTEAHAEYAPSSMYLTINCPGWLRQSALIPPQLETEATIEGSVAHAVAAAHVLGTALPPNADITEEMLDGAAVWAEALEGFPARIEQRVNMPSIHPTKIWGTPDARQWSPENKTHRVADYKFGHEFVAEFENWQLLAYTIGSLDEAYPAWRSDSGVTALMTIVQPRFYNAAPVRTWTIMTVGLLHYEARMRNAVSEAEGPSPRTVSGTHCTHCPARVNCPTFAKSVMHAIDFTGRPDPMVSTAEQIGRELALVQEFLKRLEARETGLRAVAESILRNGHRVPFYSLKQSEGRLAWTADVSVVEMMANMAGKSALKPPALVTPTQAKDRKLLDARVIAEYSARPMGAFKLTRDSDSNITRKFKT
jgi:hypothetical protein